MFFYGQGVLIPGQVKCNHMLHRIIQRSGINYVYQVLWSQGSIEGQDMLNCLDCVADKRNPVLDVHFLTLV